MRAVDYTLGQEVSFGWRHIAQHGEYARGDYEVLNKEDRGGCGRCRENGICYRSLLFFSGGFRVVFAVNIIEDQKVRPVFINLRSARCCVEAKSIDGETRRAKPIAPPSFRTSIFVYGPAHFHIFHVSADSRNMRIGLVLRSTNVKRITPFSPPTNNSTGHFCG